MRLLLTQLTLCSILLTQFSTAIAANQQFPYEAVVDAEEAALRSGPGRKYYVTNKLQHGQKVQVLRKDPGGWFMISPPAGSFSWISADAIKTEDGRQGVLTRNNVPVQVGSTLSDQHEVEQRRLSKGDVVQIIEEVKVITPQGPAVMLKITPPAGEYRWIAGRLVSPVDPQLRAQQDRDPFTVPSQIRRQKLAKHTGSNSPEQKSAQNPNSTTQRSAAEQLKALDNQFRTVVTQHKPDHWPLAQLTAEYQKLSQQSDANRLQSQIRQRLASLNQYKKIQHEYASFMALTNATSQRDANLAQMQNTISNPSAITQTGQIPLQQSLTRFPQANPQTKSMQPIPETTTFAQTDRRANGPALPPSPAAPITRPQTITLSGAGIIQQAINPDVPDAQFVLLSNEGKILAFLKSGNGVDLTQHIGQPRGVQGRRSFNQQLQADLIVVNGLTPVQLQ